MEMNGEGRRMMVGGGQGGVVGARRTRLPRIREHFARLAGEFTTGEKELALPHVALVACGRAD